MDEAPPRRKLCPICRERAPADQYKPFCSKRCADIDLGRWLTGSYVIPGSAADDEDGVGDAERREKSHDA
ncbi:MAG: DNA gyrase inhibitor YacG [Hyphomicrobiales bacterium]|nr:DNA gyrase inhibitor YacG [Hyphomicrobiales bacterium]